MRRARAFGRRPVAAGAALLALLLGAASLRAQESPRVPSELQVWTGVGLDLWLHKDWNAGLELQLRTDGNGRRFREVFAEGELGWEWNGETEVVGEFRLGRRADGWRRRAALGLVRDLWDDGPWDLRGRTRFQHAFPTDDPAEGDWRNELRLAYQVNKRWDLYAEGETWTRAYPVPAVVDQFRLSLTAGWDRREHDVRVGYRYGRGTGNRRPSAEHVVALEYGFGPVKLRRRRPTGDVLEGGSPE